MRNPMAVAGVGQGLAVAVVFQSIPIAAYSLIGAVVCHLVVRPLEERDLARRFGKSYQDDRDRIACWIPTFRATGVRRSVRRSGGLTRRPSVSASRGRPYR
ncbi:MAG: hypothetical protein AAF961_03900 [Planctomycetota bacterium]